MTTFLLIWAGQTVSALGSSLTGFALGVWVYQQTGSATRFATIVLVSTLPSILLAPFAGALVDRWNRRSALIVSNLGAGCTQLALALLLGQDRLELWHIYGLLFVSSCFGALQWPAFLAAMTQLVPKRQIGRASGIAQMGTSAAELLAPVLAGFLVVTIGLGGVVLIDVATFFFAVATLLLVRVPRAAVAAGDAAPRASLGREALAGWSVIRRRPGLLALLAQLAATNLSLGMMQVLVSPLVLSFASPAVLGRVLTTAGLGMLAGSLLMSTWGGPRRRVSGILGFLLVQGAVLVVGGLRPSAPLVAAAGFAFLFASPMVLGCSQALWLTKVEPALQGRVFAVRRMVAWSTLPLAYLTAGTLADHVFEPLLAVGGPLAPSLGRLFGVGAGRGIALLLSLVGVLLLVTVAAGSRYSRLRRLEEELPDVIPDAPPPEEAIPVGTV